MIDSLIEDLKGQMRYGNMVTKLILVNVFVFIIFTIIGAFSGGVESFSYDTAQKWFALPGDLSVLIKRPWTLFTHMFLHAGFRHLFWNMIILYWFGRITGDLLGDQRILPLYFAGGLVGAIFYLIFANLLTPYGGIAMGASAAIMAIVMAAGFLAPHYRINLLLIGEVKLMYIVAALFFIDIAMISQNSNTGGHFAHIGGSVLGGLYVYLMHSKGIDILQGVTSLFEKRPEIPKQRKPTKVVTMTSPKRVRKTTSVEVSEDDVDRILEKIKISGVSSLSQAEKDVLDRASKN